jgi:type II secretory pathway pseudopilin PulG
MTLVEVTLASAILAMSMVGILATLMQSRRLTEGSVVQNSAVTIVQGYIEQMKTMDMDSLINADAAHNPRLNTSFWIPTVLDDTHPDPLKTSTGTPPDPSTLTPGVTPTTPPGVTDNLKNIVQGTNSGAQVAWSTIWPGMGTLNVPTGTAGTNDLHLNVWVWVTDLTNAGVGATSVYGITLIYTWQYRDGNRVRYVMGNVHAIRSKVPTF